MVRYFNYNQISSCYDLNQACQTQTTGRATHLVLRLENSPRVADYTYMKFCVNFSQFHFKMVKN